jgi:hypothetical protein
VNLSSTVEHPSLEDEEAEKEFVKGQSCSPTKWALKSHWLVLNQESKTLDWNGQAGRT